MTDQTAGDGTPPDPHTRRMSRPAQVLHRIGRMAPTRSAAPGTPAPPGPHAPSRPRRTAVWALLCLASILGLLAILSIWINDQLLSNSASTQTSTAVVQDAAVRRALSVYLVDQIYANVDVSAQIEQRLPSQLKPLAAPAAAAIEGPAAQVVEVLLARPRVQALLVTAATTAHEQLIDVLENNVGHGITTDHGVVQVNLGQALREVGTDLGLPASAINALPPDTGLITVMHSDQLSLAQTGVRAIRILSAWLVVLDLAILALALYIADGMRRATLWRIGWAFVVVGLIVIAVRDLVGDYVISGLTTSQYEVPAQHVWTISTSTLGELGWAAILSGVLIVLAAVLAGPTRPATALRRWSAPVLNNRPGVTWTIAGIVYLLIVLWGGTYPLRTTFGILAFAALLAAGVYLLRRQTQREFPDATSGHGLHAAWSAALVDVRSRVPSRKAVTGWRMGKHHSAGEELARLADLHERGALTDEEFARAKAQILP